jgi:hypothetical protein
MKSLSMVITFLLTTALTAQAQLKSQVDEKQINVRESLTTPSSLFGLLSPNRFSMNQSYSLSFYSGGGQSGSLGMFNNAFNFRLSDPLMLRVDMGVMHQPFGGPKGSGLQNQNAHFMGGAELIYRPSERFMMQVGVSNNPYTNGSFGNYGFYENPFGRGTTGSFNSDAGKK